MCTECVSFCHNSYLIVRIYSKFISSFEKRYRAFFRKIPQRKFSSSRADFCRANKLRRWCLLGTASNGVGYLRLPTEYRSKVSRVATSFEKFLVENSSGRGLETSERWMVPGRGSYVKDHKRAAERRVCLNVPSVLAELVLSELSLILGLSETVDLSRIQRSFSPSTRSDQRI